MARVRLVLLIHSRINITTFFFLEQTLPGKLFVDSTIISQCLRSLRAHKTVALFGKWGSGKRTLAKQIALKLAKEEELRIKIVRDWLLLPEDLESTRSTVFIMDNPVKSQYTDSHNTEIFDCLHKLRAEKNNCFQLAVFHCYEIDKTIKLFVDAKRKIIDLFPKLFLVSFSKKEVEKIAKQEVIIKEIAMDNIEDIDMGLPSNTRSQSNRPIFLKCLNDPITFVLGELKKMVSSKNINKRGQFNLLLDMMLQNGEISKIEVDHALSGKMKENTNKEECIQHLLHSYIEETTDGKAFRTIHDIITRCTLLIAMGHGYKDSIFQNCDGSLLLDCIRTKTSHERKTYRGMLVIDKNLNIGIPTDMFPLLAEFCVQRNEMMPMLNNVKLFEDREFQIRWHEAKDRLEHRN